MTATLCGCEASAEAIVHPTEENVTPADSLAALIDRTTEAGLDAWIRRIRSAREAKRIGVLNGPAEAMFGYVEDAVIDSRGRIIVLDSRFNEVRLFGVDGILVARLGGAGQGPEEFMSPEALALGSGDTLVVADRHNVFKFFAPLDTGFAYVRQVTAEFVPEDLCLLSGEVVVQAWSRRTSTILHRYSSDGEYLSSFGTPYASPNWLVQSQLSDGPIGCASDSKIVVSAFALLPELYGYDSANQRIWTSRIADFTSAKILEEQEPDGRPSITVGGAGGDIMWNLLGLRGDAMLVQVAHRTRASYEARAPFAFLSTYILDARTGVGGFITDSLPEILAIGRRGMVSGLNDPFPQVILYEWSDGD